MTQADCLRLVMEMTGANGHPDRFPTFLRRAEELSVPLASLPVGEKPTRAVFGLHVSPQPQLEVVFDTATGPRKFRITAEAL